MEVTGIFFTSNNFLLSTTYPTKSTNMISMNLSDCLTGLFYMLMAATVSLMDSDARLGCLEAVRCVRFACVQRLLGEG